jgi:hypothetical protein
MLDNILLHHQIVEFNRIFIRNFVIELALSRLDYVALTGGGSVRESVILRSCHLF